MGRGLGLVRCQVRPPGSTQIDGRHFLAEAVVLDTEVHAGEGGFPHTPPPSKGSPAFFKSPWISHLKSTSLEIPARACRVIVGLLINARPRLPRVGWQRPALPGLQESLEMALTARIRRAWLPTQIRRSREGENLRFIPPAHRRGVGRKRVLGFRPPTQIEEEFGGREESWCLSHYLPEKLRGRGWQWPQEGQALY